MNKIHKRYVLFVLLIASALLLFSFDFWKKSQINEGICSHLSTLNLPPTTKQVLVVEAMGGIKAELIACTWNKQWQPSLFTTPIQAVIGKQGLATVGSKKEGDLKTPAGLYPLEWAFGTKPLALKMDFKYISDEDKFIDDPHHKHYNTWVNGPTSAQSYEPMQIPLYKMGVVINYNMKPIVPGAGSAIFLHIWRSEQQGTAGCVAMSEKHLLQVLHWLDKKQHPYIFITSQS